MMDDNNSKKQLVPALLVEQKSTVKKNKIFKATTFLLALIALSVSVFALYKIFSLNKYPSNNSDSKQKIILLNNKVKTFESQIDKYTASTQRLESALKSTVAANSLDINTNKQKFENINKEALNLKNTINKSFNKMALKNAIFNLQTSLSYLQFAKQALIFLGNPITALNWINSSKDSLSSTDKLNLANMYLDISNLLRKTKSANDINNSFADLEIKLSTLNLKKSYLTYTANKSDKKTKKDDNKGFVSRAIEQLKGIVTVEKLPEDSYMLDTQKSRLQITELAKILIFKARFNAVNQNSNEYLKSKKSLVDLISKFYKQDKATSRFLLDLKNIKAISYDNTLSKIDLLIKKINLQEESIKNILFSVSK